MKFHRSDAMVAGLLGILYDLKPGEVVCLKTRSVALDRLEAAEVEASSPRAMGFDGGGMSDPTKLKYGRQMPDGTIRRYGDYMPGKPLPEIAEALRAEAKEMITPEWPEMTDLERARGLVEQSESLSRLEDLQAFSHAEAIERAIAMADPVSNGVRRTVLLIRRCLARLDQAERHLESLTNDGKEPPVGAPTSEAFDIVEERAIREQNIGDGSYESSDDTRAFRSR